MVSSPGSPLSDRTARAGGVRGQGVVGERVGVLGSAVITVKAGCI